ncbi:MAG TPA: hypothetical protein VHE99_02950 [Gammaproteobacteria bacterium]|nr:hypothetical protein [Gammaproteobacteria bacterium]HVY53378.1 hypothetical protein [Gammaproteobacteria bacterium]
MSLIERMKEINDQRKQEDFEKDRKYQPSSKSTNIYKDVWEKAFERYKSQDSRPGFQMTLFSHFRHKFTLYPALAEFKQELEDEKSENSEQIMIKWLKDEEKLKNNEHSFRNYLIDELQKEFPNDDKWNKLSKHHIKFYTGIVYRGTPEHPSYVFQNGFKDTQKMNDVRYYIPLTGSGHIGVSTSKDIRIALNYTRGAVGYMGFTAGRGYLYKINLRSSNGIDLDTMGGSSKREVNVIGGISREDVMGIVNAKGEITHANPNYKPARLSEKTDNIPEALKKSFRKM